MRSRTSNSLALGLGLVLIACGGDDGGTSSGSASASTSTTSDTSPTSTPTQGTASMTGDDTSATMSTSMGTSASTGTASTTAGTESMTDGTTATTVATEGTTATATQTSTATGTATGTGTTGALGCQKVDFLFVIDNSISMQAEQAALTAAFPAFMDTIQMTLEATDYHIMVVDTDAETRCTPVTCAGFPHWTCNAANGYACMNIFNACDSTRGAGVIHPAGEQASNMLCDPFGGNRYIIDGEPDLTGTFTCMATVGLAGHPSERPMDGIVEALSDPLNDMGGCNEGFLRDDAILVITFISDDPNVEDLNTAMETYDAVVAAKGGNPDAMVVLGLIPELPPVCTPANKPMAGLHWAEFISYFGVRGIQGSVCDADYNQFFQGAVDIIDETCDIFPQ